MARELQKALPRYATHWRILVSLDVVKEAGARYREDLTSATLAREVLTPGLLERASEAQGAHGKASALGWLRRR